MQLPVRETPVSSSHFVGFHDICPWNEGDDTLLVHRVGKDLECRMPDGSQVADICLWNEATSELRKLADTRAWNWQIGARLQWMPSRPDVVAFNTIEDGGLCTRLLNVKDGSEQTLPCGLYDISPDGRTIISPCFRKLAKHWPAYGYAGLRQPDGDSGGVSVFDVVSGRRQVERSAEEIAERLGLKVPAGSNIFCSHPTFNPSGTAFVFYVRMILAEGGLFSYFIRTDLKLEQMVVVAQEKVSHFDWYDDSTLLVWARKLNPRVAALRSSGLTSSPLLQPLVRLVRFFRSRRKGQPDSEAYYMIRPEGEWEAIGRGLLTSDGHPMFSRDRSRFITDTYPRTAQRLRELCVFDMQSRTKQVLAQIPSPLQFGDGDWKCDLHPRWSRDERRVAVDSTDRGVRQVQIYAVPQGQG